MGVGAAIVAGVGAAASIGTGIMQSNAASKAGGQAAAAANRAADLQMSQYKQTREDLMPYNTTGQAQLPGLVAQSGKTETDLNNSWNTAQSHIPQPMTQEELEKTPGYQFNLAQGKKWLDNSIGSRGQTGNLYKAGLSYATGLADNTYQNQFNNSQTIFGDYNQQFSNAYNKDNAIYNQIYGPAALGESAAATSGSLGTQAANNAGTNIAAGGMAQAAGTIGAANALGQGLNNAAGMAQYGLGQYQNQQNFNSYMDRRYPKT